MRFALLRMADYEGKNHNILYIEVVSVAVQFHFIFTVFYTEIFALLHCDLINFL